MTTAERMRAKALRAREAGRDRIADLYESEAETHELLEQMAKQQQERRIQVRGRLYRVVLNFNERGEWYANAHARGDMMPTAYVAGLPTVDAAVDAIRERLAR